jgi:hypothetical protein
MMKEWLCVLLLIVGAVKGQDDAATVAEEGVEADQGEASDEGDEEAWQYVEFLKADVKYVAYFMFFNNLFFISVRRLKIFCRKLCTRQERGKGSLF